MQCCSTYSCNRPLEVDAYHDRGVHRVFFSNTTPHFWRLRTLPKKTKVGEKQNCYEYIPDEQSHDGLGTRRQSCHKEKKCPISDDLGLKELRHSETISDENCHLYRSIRQFSYTIVTRTISTRKPLPSGKIQSFFTVLFSRDKKHLRCFNPSPADRPS